jgi:phage terminase small subunit
MTSKQQRWVEEYLVDFNATQAAMRAGYSKKTAHVIGSENLQKPELKVAIEQKKAEFTHKTGMKVGEIIAELALIAFSDINHYVSYRDDGTVYFDWSDMPIGASQAVRELSQDAYWEGSGEASREVKRTRFKLHDKLKALELLGRYHAMFTDKAETAHTLTDRTESPKEKIVERLKEIAARRSNMPSEE